VKGAFDTAQIPFGLAIAVNVDKERQRNNIYDVPKTSTVNSTSKAYRAFKGCAFIIYNKDHGRANADRMTHVWVQQQS